MHRGREIGVRATVPGAGITPAELVARLAALTARQPLALMHGPPLIQSGGIVSGSGARTVHEAISAGLDAFITGEPAEWASAIARESRIHFIAAGHHATETFGPRALGEHLARSFGVAHTDIPIVNPV